MTKPQTYLRVATIQPADKVLTYLPGPLAGDAAPVGKRVMVPIGKRTVAGVVVEITSEQPPGTARPIEDVLDNQPILTEDILALSKWVAQYYLCGWVEAIRAALPAGLLRNPRLLIAWTGPDLEMGWPPEVREHATLARVARTVLSAGQISATSLANRIRMPGLFGYLHQLEDHNLLRITEQAGLNAQTAFTEELVKATVPHDQAEIPAKATARQRLWDTLWDKGGQATWKQLRAQVNAARPLLDALIEADLVKTERITSLATEGGFDPRAAGPLPPLSEDQAEAVNAVIPVLSQDHYRGFLLTGPPGCGKTRVYVELIKKAVSQSKGVVLLVPEIALTPQVVARIHAGLDVPVAVLHSALTPAQRVAAWREVREGRIKVVVGARSAVFAPVQNLGLVVVDEEHEESFKQADPAPRYHGRDVALMRARLNNAVAVVVSATPSLESLRLAEEGGLTRLVLRERFGAGWPEISIVDRRRESGDAPFIGPDLTRELEAALEREEAVMLMLTRRGFAPVLICKDCGYREECDHCAVTMTYHNTRDGAWLRCHMCGAKKNVPEQCPKCGSAELIPAGAGTQRIEEEIARRFPALAPIRMDSDTTRKSGMHEELLRRFSGDESALLIGTQMVAKGHDFPNVTLVGIVNADPSLYLPDFRASERTFRLLVQAAGRAGRGDKPGKVVVQSLTPDHEVLRSLHKPNIDEFLKQELERRRAFDYPPFARMVLLTVAAEDHDKAADVAFTAAKKLRAIGKPLLIMGPSSALVVKVKRQYRWRVLVRTRREDDPSGRILRNAVRRVHEEIKIPNKVSWLVDVDPLEVA